LLAELRRFEAGRRAAADFASMPSSDRRLGADPYVVRRLSADRFVGILRGTGAVVLLDGALREVARVEAPGSPSGLALSGDRAFVVGERSAEVREYRVGRDGLTARGGMALGGARALRDVTAGPGGVLYAVEEDEGRLFTLVPKVGAAGGYEVVTTVVGAGAFRVVRTASAVVVGCLLAHTIAAYRVDARGRPQGQPAIITNDGPLWSFSASEEAGGLMVASGGVENRRLDRTHGSFENIDSFVYVHRVVWGGDGRGAGAAEVAEVAAVNVSEHGVIVPKAIELRRGELRRGEAGSAITVTGYGGEAFAEIWLAAAPGAKPEVVSYPLPPGTNAFVRVEEGPHRAGERPGREPMVIANPLLDAWILTGSEGAPATMARVSGPGDMERSPASRLGEALIFTTLIAPWTRSDGPLSRFTCETCHFEGYGDGRVHATGRGEVRATTKPLLGLFNNRPHFSRALDPDLSSVAHNEFRVAGARSDHDPVFDLKLGERGWVAGMGVTAEDLTAVGLRRAFMTFLMDLSHRPPAISAGRAAFSEDERRGARLFRERCEGCHEARLASDVADSRVPLEGWEAKVFSGAAPIVWAGTRYAKTGVVPYVHDEGARVPSLRRLSKKQPYFTNGAASSLGEVLARVRFGEGQFFHDGAPVDAAPGRLSNEERAALAAFLRLL